MPTEYQCNYAEDRTMTVERITSGDLAGGWFITARYRGELIKQSYLYYTQTEAMRKFRKLIKELHNK